MIKKNLFYPLVVVSLWSAGSSHAAPPNAGRTIRSIEQTAPEVPKESAPVIELQSEQEPTAAQSTIKIPVTAFSISGNSIYPELVLQQLMQDGVGKELTLTEIESLANRITQHYRSHGYFVAFAYLPAQDIVDGKVSIAVVEGKYGAVEVKHQDVIASTPIKVATGEVVSLDPLERGLLLLTDTPGVEVKSTLKPGASVGTSDLIVEVAPGKRFTGSVDVDNFGNTYTGKERVGLTLNVNNPTQHGDVISLRAVTSGSQMNYGRLSYQIPVNTYGTKVGAAYTYSDYELGKEFSQLDAHGDAKVASLFALHPFIRSRQTNLNGQLNYERKDFEDQIDELDTDTDRKLDVLNIGLSGDRRDGLWGGGVNAFTATLVLGNLDIESPVAKVIDDLTAKTDGHYSKFALSMLRLQNLTARTSLYLAYNGQLASGNLDSSEKFITGGAYGVRAYPEGEASADEAHLLTAELRHDLPAGFQAVGFLDTAYAKLIDDPWPAADGDNYRTLSDWGVGLNWAHQNGYNVKAFYAHKIGNEKATSDSDRDGRFWVQAVKYF